MSKTKSIVVSATRSRRKWAFAKVNRLCKVLAEGFGELHMSFYSPQRATTCISVLLGLSPTTLTMKRDLSVFLAHFGRAIGVACHKAVRTETTIGSYILPTTEIKVRYVSFVVPPSAASKIIAALCKATTFGEVTQKSRLCISGRSPIGLTTIFCVSVRGM